MESVQVEAFNQLKLTFYSYHLFFTTINVTCSPGFFPGSSQRAWTVVCLPRSRNGISVVVCPSLAISVWWKSACTQDYRENEHPSKTTRFGNSAVSQGLFQLQEPRNSLTWGRSEAVEYTSALFYLVQGEKYKTCGLTSLSSVIRRHIRSSGASWSFSLRFICSSCSCSDTRWAKVNWEFTESSPFSDVAKKKNKNWIFHFT